jgi:isoquinoline 1-oxidoreductase beta subunit
LPDIHVELIASDEHPPGVGQMPVTVVAPAIGNVMAGLTGVRLRATPMTAECVKKALG